jgi:hypothetical protein
MGLVHRFLKVRQVHHAGAGGEEIHSVASLFAGT